MYWYFLKRHGITELSYDNSIVLSKERFVFPLPDAEKEYGWTASHDAQAGKQTPQTNP